MMRDHSGTEGWAWIRHWCWRRCDAGVRTAAAQTPGPDEVLIRTLYSGISAGTELSQYRGSSPFMTRSWDAERRVFRDGDPSWTFPVRNLGYEEVGRIEEVGSGVTRVQPGQLVFGAWNHRGTHLMREAEAEAKLTEALTRASASLPTLARLR